ncbi:anacyclamide/piricyclamide family prenylated cyclic peptide [Microseira sp. BLCC-F43]|jgi:prenylated cyclic peptide (anacyclamide/piricyclamide family)|uniref:anacyclamide/piricyclamide family prenylated cyclic peptide n=1 Tax=Microseira sp. BLCC-F43 TaxID=3153602 RepID=UPI0035BA1248
MKTKKSLNPQIVAPVERTTATSRNNAGSPSGLSASEFEWTLVWGTPFSGDDAE